MIQKISLNSPFYPPILKNIYDPPKVLYIKGTLPVGKYIAIVGTRQITNSGHMLTAEVTKEFVKNGYIIVSGMALGVDAVAQQTAINNGGKTVAVLGAGVNIIYPPENKKLYDDILASGGAIVSEVPPDKTVPRSIFAARNRIISGMSEGVVITEANLKSGSMITARLALDQGKDVFCVPGSPGCDYLIEMGAYPITLLA